MKKPFLLSFVTMLSFMLITSGTLYAQRHSRNIAGTWNFKAPDAPYEYSEGKMIIKKDKEIYTFVIAFDENNKIQAYDVKVKDKEIACKVNVEGDVISIKAVVRKNQMDGDATYSGGTIAFTATREKKNK